MSENYQGREIQATLKAPTSESLENMLSELEDYANEVEMDEVEVLKKGRDRDGGWEAIVVAHNFNPLTWLKEKWEARGGGPEDRLKREEYARLKRLAKEKQKAELATMRSVQEKARATVVAGRAQAETTRARAVQAQRVATRTRRTATQQLREATHAARLETFEEGIRRVGGFAGAQAATFQTVVHVPAELAGSAEHVRTATRPTRPYQHKSPWRPPAKDIFGTPKPIGDLTKDIFGTELP